MADKPPSREELAALAARIERLRADLRDALERIERLETGTASLIAANLPADPSATPPVPGTPATEQVEIVAELVEEPIGRPQKSPPRSASTSPFAHAPKIPTPRRQSVPRTGKEERIDWEAWIGGRGLTWIGGAVLVIALGFAVHWVATTFQTPPELEVAGLHLLGVALLAGGHVANWRRLPVLASGVAGLGIFTLYATAFATYRIYEFGTSLTAFAEGALITVVAIGVALRSRSATVILLGALGGYLTPVLTFTGSENYAALFSYLAFLNVALVACSVWRQWRFLKPIALAATAVMFLSWIAGDTFQSSVDRWGMQLYLVVHGLIFLAAAVLPPWLWKQESTPLDLLTLSANSMGFMGATYALFRASPDQQLALVSWAMAALHTLLLAVTYARVGHADRMPRVQLALAAVFVTLAAPLQIDDARYWGLAWCVEGLVFTGIGVYFRDRQMQASAWLMFAVALLRIFAWDYLAPAERIVGTPIDLRFAVIALAGAIMAAAGAAYWFIPWGLAGEWPQDDSTVAGGGLLAVGNLVVLLAMTCQWEGRLVLLFWTLNAAALWACGFWRRWPAVRWYALGVAVLMAGGRLIHDFPWLDITDAAPIWNARFGTFSLLAAVYFVAGWTYWRRAALNERSASVPSDRHGDLIDGERHVDILLGLAANAVLLLAVSLEISYWYDVKPADAFPAVTDTEMAHMASYSVVWAVYAALLVGVGFLLRYPLLRYIGLFGFGPILAKVFLVDLHDLELLPRVLAFAVLGAMLLGVSYLYQRFTARLRGT